MRKGTEGVRAQATEGAADGRDPVIRRPPNGSLCRGLTLVEAVVSIVVVSTMVVGALNCVGTARTNELRLIERERAVALAEGLMCEILRQAYADPTGGPQTFGIGSDENTGNRSLFEDVDDYDGWDASPPQYKDGTVIPGCNDYEQVVHVAWVDPGDLASVAGSNTGIKRIQVVIKHAGAVVITLTGYRSELWTNPATWAGVVWP